MAFMPLTATRCYSEAKIHAFGITFLAQLSKERLLLKLVALYS